MSLKGPVEWRQLESLCSGYLHQDFAVVHGSAVDAVRAWLADATPRDAITLASEWRRFLNITHGMDVDARVRALHGACGGSWAPTTAEFEAVSAVLLDAWRR
jgi:hypothetical protein